MTYKYKAINVENNKKLFIDTMTENGNMGWRLIPETYEKYHDKGKIYYRCIMEFAQ